MNRCSYILKYALAAILVATAMVGVRAQPDASALRAAGKRAYDEAGALYSANNARAYRAALEKYQESARIYEQAGDRPNVASALIGVGQMKNLLGETDAALETYERALKIFEEFDLPYFQARVLNNIGRIYDDLGDKQKALAIHARALKLRRVAGDDFGEAQTLNATGAVYADLGERQTALDYYRRALEIFTTLDATPQRAMVLSNIAKVHDALGDHARAIDVLKQSLALRLKAKDREGEAVTLNNLGLAYSYADAEKAVESFRAALKILDERGLDRSSATIYNNLGAVLIGEKRFDEALDLAARAVPVMRRYGNRAGEATALNNVGLAKFYLGRDATAEFNSALSLARATGDRALAAVVLGNLMLAYRTSNPGASIFFGKECVNTYQELRAAIGGLDDATRATYLRSIEENYRQLADLLIENGQFADAATVLAMLKDEEFSTFVNRSSGETDTLSRRVGMTQREKNLADKFASLGSELNRLSSEFDKLEIRRLRALDGGAPLTDAEAAELARLGRDLERARTEFRTFLERGVAGEDDKKTSKRAETDVELQARIGAYGKRVAMLTTVVAENRYRVILTTATSQVAGKTEISSAALNEKIFNFRAALQLPGEEPRPIAKELYDVLVKPVEAALDASGAETLVWSLDGALRYIPVAALSPDGAGYLVEKYQNVVLTPQTRDDLAPSKVKWKALGMGVSAAQSVETPDSPGEPVKFAALPAVERELKSIVRQIGAANEDGILEGRRFLNDEFSVDALTNALGKREFDVVHLASHFRLASNWSDSFILLGRGKILTLEQLNSMPKLDFADVDLVTLSACNTATGEEGSGREVDGLAGVIQLKNGRSVLATLWEVEDASTSALMTSFYRARADDPLTSKAAAMQSAQKSLLYGGKTAPKPSRKPVAGKFTKNPSRPFAHPAFWAAFVLIGNWR